MKSRLFSRGFVSLVVTQFFGAANDNIVKRVLIYMVIDGAWAAFFLWRMKARGFSFAKVD